MKKNAVLLLLMCLPPAIGFAQTPSDHDEFVYTHRLIRQTHSYIPKDGFVPDKSTAIAVAYAIALPIYGKDALDKEKPFRAELENGVWTVLGTLNCGSCVGGTLAMQIDKASGKVLFFIHYQ